MEILSRTVSPAERLAGTVTLPGDKSVSHRFGMFSAIAEGTTRIANFSGSEDCTATLNCMAALGVPIERTADEIVIHGVGKHGLKQPDGMLDAGNSGTTIRLLSGILAGQPFETRITGDDSLRRRPMRRIMDPLARMGARIVATDDNFAPLAISGGNLRGIDYELPVASAQVKSCVLLAGLFAAGETTVIEATPTRDHTERMLGAFGAPVVHNGTRLTISGDAVLKSPGDCRVPGDFSAAAFFLVAASLVPDADLLIENVGINPSRTGLLDVLHEAGLAVGLENEREAGGEPVADLRVRGLHGDRLVRRLELGGDIIANVIDELPILSVFGAFHGGIDIRDARELRVKESDRIALVAANLRRMGAEVIEREDGLSVEGNQRFRSATIDTAGDHRIAMAFSVAALAADGPTEIRDAGCAAVSFPKFFDVLASLRS
jgi:3-phosphoshikimate 1-carboxyvinyltransferase